MMKTERRTNERLDLLAIYEGAVRTFEIENLDTTFFAHLNYCVDS